MDVMSRVSPELVLVDHELREEQRALLRDPQDCLQRVPRPVVTAATPIHPLGVSPAPGPVETRVIAAPRPVLIPSPVFAGTPPPAVDVPAPLDDPPLARRRPVARKTVLAEPTSRRLRARHLPIAAVWAVTILFVFSPLLAFLPTPSSQVPRLLAPGSNAAGPRATGSARTQPATELPNPPEPSGSAPTTQKRSSAETRKRPQAPVTTAKSQSTRAKKQSTTAKKQSATKQKQSAPKHIQPTTNKKQATAEQKQPRAKQKPATTPTGVEITWPAVPSSVVYNIIFVHGEERIDVWSRDNRLTLTPSESSGPPKEYGWFAYAGFRDEGAVRYGPLVAHGMVRASRNAIPKTEPPAGGQVR